MYVMSTYICQGGSYVVGARLGAPKMRAPLLKLPHSNLRLVLVDARRCGFDAHIELACLVRNMNE